MTQNENEEFYCINLSKNVYIELGYASISNIIKTINSFDCASRCYECGVVTKSKTNWDVCPAYKKYIKN